MQTCPLHQGWSTSHARVSNPSAASFSKVRSSPSEPPVPRQFCTRTAKPACNAGVTGRVRAIGSLYGVRTSRTGRGSPEAGRCSTAARPAPSRTGTRTCSTVTVDRSRRIAGIGGLLSSAEEGEGPDLDAVPWRGGGHRRVPEGGVDDPPGAVAVRVVELEEQDLVAGHVREVPPAVVGVELELRPAGRRPEFADVAQRVLRDPVDEVQLVGQALVGTDAAEVADGERPVLRWRAEDPPDAGGQRPPVAG